MYPYSKVLPTLGYFLTQPLGVFKSLVILSNNPMHWVKITHSWEGAIALHSTRWVIFNPTF